MSDIIILQHYHSLSEFVLSHRLILPKPRDGWRLLARPCLGSINGLSRTFTGIAVATNGIIVAIENGAHKILFAHLQWFEKEDEEYETDLDIELGNTAKRKPSCVELFNDLFQDEIV